jgi:hypothetical protein
MEYQIEHVQGSGEVKFQDVKVGKGCVYVHVSTIGNPVNGKNVTVGDHTTVYGGQMSDVSLQGLPVAQGVPNQQPSASAQSADGARFGGTNGAGYTLAGTRWRPT